MIVPAARAVLGEAGLVAELWPRAPYEACEEDGRAPGRIGFAFEAQAGVDAIGGTDRARPFRRGENTLAWLPPGCPVFSASPHGGEYLLLRGLGADAVGHPAAAARAVNDVVDPAALTAARALRRWLLSGAGPAGAPQAEALDLMSAALLARFADGLPQSVGWLTPARLATLDRMAEQRMAGPLSVADIAAELGLSVGFIVLAFRRALGTTPHRWLMERRLARARILLATGAAPAEAAAAAGFADQAHLARHARAALGVTPGWLRQASRAGRLPAPGSNKERTPR